MSGDRGRTFALLLAISLLGMPGRAASQGSGGFVIDGTSPEVVSQLRRIVDDIAALYVIGFTAAPSKKIEHRRLKVEIARRDVTVRHREGYETRPR